MVTFLGSILFAIKKSKVIEIETNVSYFSCFVSLILKVSRLHLDFQLEGKTIPILRNLNFSIPKGETLALVGETGCGKSMTASAIMRLLPSPALPLRGEVLFQGKDLLKFSDREMRKVRGGEIGMIFQDPRTALNPVYTIGDQLAEVCEHKLQMHNKKEIEHKIWASLEEVQLPNPKHLSTLFPHQLSGGMLQRVMIAMALIGHPKLLIADEPTTALDVTIQSQILSLLDNLKKKREMSILLITHDMGVVSKVADQVIVMYAGQKIECGPTKDLFKYKMHPYTQALLEAMPSPFIPRGTLPVLKGNVPDPKALPKGCSFCPRCPHAMSLCREGETPYFFRERSTQEVKCWLYDQDLEWKIDD
jgi:oligopeptide/dipeptide ABC transporter ATP-binding protein